MTTPPDVRDALRRLHTADSASTARIESYLLLLHEQVRALGEADPFRGWVVAQGHVLGRVALLLDRLDQGPLADLAAAHRMQQETVLLGAQAVIERNTTIRGALTQPVILAIVAGMLGSGGALTLLVQHLLQQSAVLPS